METVQLRLTSDLSSVDVTSLGIDLALDSSGHVLIRSVARDSLMAKLGVLRNDILVTINEQPIDSPWVIRAACDTCLPSAASSSSSSASSTSFTLTATVQRDVTQEASNREAMGDSLEGLQIAAQLGNPLCERCAQCAATIVEDEGSLRYHCVDCAGMADYCVVCVERAQGEVSGGGRVVLRAPRLGGDGGDSDEVQVHPDWHRLVLEDAGPVSLRLRVLGDAPAVTLNNALRVYAGRPLFGTRVKDSGDSDDSDDSVDGYDWLTYDDVRVRAMRLAAGLRRLLPVPGVEARTNVDMDTLDCPEAVFVGLCGANRVEWLLADFACTFHHAVSVGLHTNWPAEERQYVLNNSRAVAVFADHELIPAFLESAPSCPNLRFIICLDRDVEDGEFAADGVAVYSLREVEEMAEDPDTLETCSGISLHTPVRTASLTFASHGADVADADTLDAAPGPPQLERRDSAAERELCRRETCNHYAAADGLYSLESLKARVRGPEGYCDSCYNHATDVPEIVAHRLQVTAEIKAEREQHADPLYTLVYSSGSTGLPKGCMMLESSWNQSVAGANTQRFISPNVILSYAALGHAMDRMMIWQTMTNGGRVGFVSPGYDFDELLDCLGALRPRLFVAMPDFWNALFANYMFRLESKLRNRASASSPEERVLKLRDEALKETAAQLGGRILMVGTGGAAISPVVLKFMRDAFGCAVTNAYGTTEASGISNNGAVNADVELELRGVGPAEDGHGGYSLHDVPYPRGEIVVHTPGMIGGYYRNPEQTAETFELDAATRKRWCLTGDIGEREPGANGHLRIIDRKKNFLELYYQGRSVWLAPERLQSTLLESSMIQRIFVHGERTTPYLVAVIVPNAEFVREWCAQVGLGRAPRSAEDNARLGDNALFRSTVLNELDRIGKLNGLREYEIPRGVVFEFADWTPERRELTSTGKLVRPRLREKYRHAIDKELARLTDGGTAAVPHGHSAAAGGESENESSPPPLAEPRLERIPSVTSANPHQQLAFYPTLVELARSALSAVFPDFPLSSEAATTGIMAKLPFSVLADGDPYAAALFYKGVRDFLRSSDTYWSVVPPLDYLVTQPLGVIAETVEFGLVQKLISGWTDRTEDHVAKELDTDTFAFRETVGALGPNRYRLPADAQATLVTGVLSCVGAHAVAALLARGGGGQVVCLVPTSAFELDSDPLHSVMLKYGLWEGAVAKAAESGLVRLLPGDVCAPRFGLAPEQYAMVSAHVRTVLHLHEATAYSSHYQELRNANVVSVSHVIAFARSSYPRKRIVHLSNVAVFRGWGARRFSPKHPDTPDQLHPIEEDCEIGASARVGLVLEQDGYCQSKWVAERMLQRAQEELDGLDEVRVVRAGNVSFGLQTGSFHRGQFVTQLFTAMLQLGGAYPVPKPAVAPAKTPEMFLNLTPVDVLGEALATASLADNDSALPVYHVVCGSTMVTLTSLLVERDSVDRLPCEPTPLDVEDWRLRVLDAGVSCAGLALWHFMSSFPEFGVFATERTVEALQVDLADVPVELFDGFVLKVAAGLRESALVPSPRHRHVSLPNPYVDPERVEVGRQRRAEAEQVEAAARAREEAELAKKEAQRAKEAKAQSAPTKDKKKDKKKKKKKKRKKKRKRAKEADVEQQEDSDVSLWVSIGAGVAVVGAVLAWWRSRG